MSSRITLEKLTTLLVVNSSTKKITGGSQGEAQVDVPGKVLTIPAYERQRWKVITMP